MRRSALAIVERFAEYWSAWMIEMSIQVVVLAAAVAVLAWIFRRRSASLRYTLWLIVLVRLVTPPDLAAPTGWGWWLREGARTSVATIPHRSERARPIESPSNHLAPVTVTPTGESRLPTGTDSVEKSALRPSPIDEPEPTWAALLMLGWAGVSLTLLAYLVAGAARTRRWVRQASPEIDPNVRRLFGRCRWRLEITQKIELRDSQDCTTPLVVGWWRPVILLPSRVLRELTDEELEAVLLHELNHIARRDALVNLMQAVLGSLYFFHPAVWWANRELRRLREDACDEMTVGALEGRRHAYGSALIKVSEILGYDGPPLALGIMETSHPAKRRLGRILDPHLPLSNRGGGLAATLVGMLAVIFLPGAPQPVGDKPGNADDTGVTANTAIAPTLPQASAPARHQPSGDDQRPNVTPPQLRYRWTQGASVGYSVQIEAQDENGVETHQGHVHYTIRNVQEGRATLAVQGWMHGFRRVHPGAAPPLGRPSVEFYSPFEQDAPSGFFAERTLTVNDIGGVETSRGHTPLPWALGDLGRLPLVPLPADAAAVWEVSGPTTVTWNDAKYRFPRPTFLRPELETLSAQETNGYRIAGLRGSGEATIERQVEITTTQLVNGEPRLAIQGGGEAVFDRQSGSVRSLEWRLTLTVREEFAVRVAKITVVCQRQEAVPNKDDPSRKVDLDQAVAELDASETDRVLTALRVFQQATPNENRRAVTARLALLLDDPDPTVRIAGAQAYAHWANGEEVERLLQLLDDPETPVRWAAIDALGRLAKPAAATALAGRLEVGIDRVAASRALRRLGAAAEEAVLPWVVNEDPAVQLAAIHILRDIGGPLSLPPLQAIAETDPQDATRRWAKHTITAIEKRIASDR